MLSVTTSTVAPPEHFEKWWVVAGCPLILIEDTYDSSFSHSLDGLDRAWSSELRDADPIAAHYFLRVQQRGVTVPVWIVLHDSGADKGALRNLRIHLWRLHNEREVLKSILTLCLEERLAPAKSELLRDYLAKQSDRLRRRRAEGFSQRELLDYAYQLDDLINQQDIAKLKSILDSIGPGISASVMPIVQGTEPETSAEQAPHLLVYLESGNLMIDKSQKIGRVENAGAIVSGDAQISGGSFQGSGTQGADALAGVDLAQLAQQLSTLRKELRSQGDDVEQDLVVADVAKAERAATQGDRAGVLKALSKVGQWALDAATQIGTTLAAEVIRAATGLP